jgi:hypothetical protein
VEICYNPILFTGNLAGRVRAHGVAPSNEPAEDILKKVHIAVVFGSNVGAPANFVSRLLQCKLHSGHRSVKEVF